MINPFVKIKILTQHCIPSAMGVIRLLFTNPFFCIKLLALKTLFFFSNKVFYNLDTPDNYRITRDNELTWYWSIFIERELWHPSWINALKTADNPIVLDIGANAGLFSHLVFILNKTSHVTAFEPLPVMAQCIRDLAKNINADITVINKAVSDKSGEATLYSSSDNDVCSSLNPIPDAKMPIQVSVTTLDSELSCEKILLAKIDVEGLECAVLDGAKETISKTRFLLLEALSMDALRDIKSKLGDDWICHKVGVTDYFFERLKCE